MSEIMNEQPLVTVVSAVYKTEEYFKMCVDSLLNCEYKNLEIILVDDGSPDNCPALCDEYAKKDCRIRVVHKENGGCASAINTGIKLANGKYTVFCDNDDQVPPNAYSVLVKKALETDADVVRGTICKVSMDTGNRSYWYRKETDSIRTKTVGFQGALYRTAMLQDHDIHLIPYRLGDDVGFVIQVLQFEEKVEYIEDVVYEYTARPSATENKSAMQMTDFNHYYDDFRWRNWALEYINNSDKLSAKGKGHLGEFCMNIDRRWFSYTEAEREILFGELKKLANAIDWSSDVQNSKGYLKVDNEKLQSMNRKQYEKCLRLEFWIKGPLRKVLKKG